MRTKRTLVFALALTLAGYSASAQDAKKTEPAKDAKETKKPAPVAFVGADIYTVTKGVLRNGIVIVENGKIKAVGQDIEIPEGATKVDVSGKVLTPGLVTINATNIAVRGGGGGGPRGGGPPALAGRPIESPIRSTHSIAIFSSAWARASRRRVSKSCGGRRPLRPQR